MTFAQLMTSAALTARRPQADLATQVVEHLARSQAATLAVQATTGIGKTWALAYAALGGASQQQRVVWSTHTIALRGQVLETLDRAVEAAPRQNGSRITVAERRGRADYPSASRALRLRHALRDRGAEQERIVQLDALAAWSGTIAEFVTAYGELVVPQTLVCLTASCPSEEQATYLAQRDIAANSQIVVQTHALTLIEARFHRLHADLVIFDEADTLPGVAAGATETRLVLDELAALASLVGADIGELLEALRQRLESGAAMTWRDDDMASKVRALATRLRQAATAAPPELGEACADTVVDLLHFATVEQPKTGAALVQDAAAGPVLAVASVDPAGWLGTALQGRQVVLMSATLGAHEDADLAKECRRLGFWDVSRTSVSLEQFGSMQFRLADRRVPTPFADGGTVNAGFYDYAAAMIRAARRAGRTLVLCASYGDVAELASRLDRDAIIQRRGQMLRPLVERFCSEPSSVLVTPSAWAGLDLPHLIDNVVIVRLPVPRPDALREQVLAEALVRRGRAPGDACDVLKAEGRADTMRRLTQGMGRGIRSENDRCTVWIADPRFPLPASMMTDLRRKPTQGAAARWLDMAQAIPSRFRRPGGRSAFDRAQIVPLTLGSVEPDVSAPLVTV